MSDKCQSHLFAGFEAKKNRLQNPQKWLYNAVSQWS